MISKTLEKKDENSKSKDRTQNVFFPVEELDQKDKIISHIIQIWSEIKAR